LKLRKRYLIRKFRLKSQVVKCSSQVSLQEYDESLTFTGKCPDNSSFSLLSLHCCRESCGIAEEVRGVVDKLKQNSNPCNILFLVSKQSISSLKFINIKQAYFVLLYFTDVMYSINWKFVVTFCLASILVAFSQQHFFPFVSLFPIFGNSQYFRLFHYYVCYDDLWSVVFDVILWFTEGSDCDKNILAIKYF